MGISSPPLHFRKQNVPAGAFVVQRRADGVRATTCGATEEGASDCRLAPRSPYLISRPTASQAHSSETRRPQPDRHVNCIIRSDPLRANITVPARTLFRTTQHFGNLGLHHDGKGEHVHIFGAQQRTLRHAVQLECRANHGGGVEDDQSTARPPRRSAL